MKKKLCSSICLLCLSVITLCACGKQKQGNPIALPNKDEIISIGVSDGEKLGFSPNTEGEADSFISEFLSILMDMEVTNKESITDVPSNKDYITINLNCNDKTITLFYYKEKDANDTGLAGCKMYVIKEKDNFDDFYLYQECGTPIDENTVDNTKRQWAYVQWVVSK